MQLTIKGTNYELTAEVREIAEKKLAACEKYLGKDAGSAHLYLTLGKATEAHRTGAIWSAEANLDVEGERLHADSLEESLENAIDKVVQELTHEIRKTRGKKQGLMRRGGSMVKNWLRGSK